MLIHILIKPDAFINDKIKEVLNEIYRHGIKVCLWSPIKPTNTLLSILSNNFQWKYDFYSHNLSIYNLGFSVSLVCDIDEHNIAHLKSIKGSSLPKDGIEGSIRYNMCVSDRCANFIHIADNQVLSILEIYDIYQIEKNQKIIFRGQGLSLKEISKGIKKFTDSLKTTSYIEIRNNVYNRGLNKIRATKKLNKDTNNMKQNYYILKNLLTNYFEVLDYKDSTMRLRFLDYLFSVFEINQIFISEAEKYMLNSETLYYSVNK